MVKKEREGMFLALLGSPVSFPYGLTSRPEFCTSLLVTENETA
jgi:hypothetical protein